MMTSSGGEFGGTGFGGLTTSGTIGGMMGTSCLLFLACSLVLIVGVDRVRFRVCDVVNWVLLNKRWWICGLYIEEG